MKFRRLTATAVLAIAALALTACTGAGGGGSAPSPKASSGGTLTIADIQDVKSFDPAQAHIGHFLLYFQPVYDSLLRREPDGTLVPMLATKWSYNADKTELTLTIRKGVTFTDGTALDADAVKINLDRFRTGNGPDASTLASVTSVDAPNATTVVIHLKEQNPGLLGFLGNADGFIASPKALDGGKIATAPVGSGPYALDAASTIPGSKYVFVKNKNYWNASLQKYAKLIVKPIPDPTATLNALLSGQADAAMLSPKTAAPAKNAGFTQHEYPTDWQGMLIYDRAGTVVPALADVRVRQAINYAIDKKTILAQVQKGFGAVTSQIFGKSSSAYLPAMDDAYPYNPGKAKKLMAEAGYANGFSVTMPNAPGVFDPSLIAGIQQNLGAIGITVNWVNVAPSDYVSSMIQGKWAMAWSAFFQDTSWVETSHTIAPTATYNPFHTNDPKVEELIHSIQTGTDSTAATAAKDLNKYLTAQAWFVPFYRVNQVYFTDAKTKVIPQVSQVVPSIYNFSPAK